MENSKDSFFKNSTACKNSNLNTDLTHYTKINSKWIIHRNVKCKMIKLFKENLCDLGLGDEFLNIVSMEWCMKEKIGKLDFIIIKTCST